MSISFEIAKELADLLARIDQRVVFAESCTCGMVAAYMGSVPGISNFLCGSAVTYRQQTKQDWLSVPQPLLDQHTPESVEVSACMAEHVLAETPEASWSLATTGHLGPDAPREIDGVVFIAIARRASEISVIHTTRLQLTTTERVDRQAEAAKAAIIELLSAIRKHQA